MNNSMIFHGVGQGLFYSGEIELESRKKFSFVYDCGTKRNIDKHFLKEAINTIHSHIDYLIISHFHVDHINGIRELLKGRTVGKIFLPYFDIKTCRNAFIAYLLVNDIGLNDDTNISFIMSLFEGRQEIQETIPVDIDKVCSCSGWNFAFFNKRIEYARIMELEKKLQGLLSNQTMEEFIKYNDKAIIKIKKIYNQMFPENPNLTSLLLLHYSDSGKQTMLTGDVVLDEELEKRINRYLGRHYVLQVPHHGGMRNWRSMSKDFWSNAEDLVFSYGSPTNQYHHPSPVCFQEITKEHYPTEKIHHVYGGNSYVYTIC